MKIAVVLGTRPEAIKMAPIVLKLKDHSSLTPLLCATGQHREMLQPVLELFELEPTVNFDVMKPNQSLNSLMAVLLQHLDAFFTEHEPDLVLVQGDTMTALCGALAAFYKHIPVGHVEAGLRTGDLYSPWPEEAHRVLIGRVCQLHFAPTTTSEQHLLRESTPPDSIFVTGNTVIDALLQVSEKVDNEAITIEGFPDEIMKGDQPLVLITGHRRESFGGGLASICRAIKRLARQFPNVYFVYPVHLNPNVRGPVNEFLNDPNDPCDNIILMEPLSYLPFVTMLKRSTLLLTDSGGIQEEAPGLGKPVLVTREKTERTEAVDAGTVILVGTDEEKIVAETSRLLTDQDAYDQMAQAINPYGDGQSAGRIIQICQEFLQKNRQA